MFNIEQTAQTLQNFTFIDLFCGIGGFHLALSSYGARCVFASEINKTACEIYEQNFNLKPHGDITTISNADIPAHDILCAGFPCQAFSISGKGNGFNDPNGKLFFEIIRIAQHHQPKLIMLENVRNLESHDQGNTLSKIIAELNNIGYKTYYDVLTATNFGVPQARKRIYIVAFRNDLNINNFTFPQRKGNINVLNDILQVEVDQNCLITIDYKIDQKLLNQPDPDRSCIQRVGQTGLGRQGERIYSPTGQAITLSSQGGGPGGKTGMYYINDIVRKLTPRECARLMGFPDKFEISPISSVCYRQFGNSVVVNVLQEIVAAAARLIS